jgi:transketolase
MSLLNTYSFSMRNFIIQELIIIMDYKRIATLIRQNILKATAAAGSGHPGGSLSIADVLTVLYFKFMNIDPKNPQKADRDRFVLCKGHSAPALYATLAERGFFSPELLITLRKPGSILQGHPDRKLIPGVDMSTGSLGQGLSLSQGLALGAKLNKLNNHIFAVMGDGETQEGQCWEAFMSIAHFKLDNLCAIIDYNKLQVDGSTKNIMSIEPLNKKLIAFNWNVIEIDGHNYSEIENAFFQAKQNKNCKPTAIISHSIKGKGVSFMENNLSFHGNAPSKDELEKGLEELRMEN